MWISPLSCLKRVSFVVIKHVLKRQIRNWWHQPQQHYLTLPIGQEGQRHDVRSRHTNLVLTINNRGKLDQQRRMWHGVTFAFDPCTKQDTGECISARPLFSLLVFPRCLQAMNSDIGTNMLRVYDEALVWSSIWFPNISFILKERDWTTKVHGSYHLSRPPFPCMVTPSP